MELRKIRAECTINLEQVQHRQLWKIVLQGACYPLLLRYDLECKHVPRNFMGTNMDIIGGIGNVIDLVKKAKHVADKLKTLEITEIIVDLQSQLIDLKE